MKYTNLDGEGELNLISFPQWQYCFISAYFNSQPFEVSYQNVIFSWIKSRRLKGNLFWVIVWLASFWIKGTKSYLMAQSVHTLEFFSFRGVWEHLECQAALRNLQNVQSTEESSET